MNGITTFSSGPTFSTYAPVNWSGTGIVNAWMAGHPNWRTDLPEGQRTFQKRFNTSAFVVPTHRCLGRSGRNTLRTDGIANVDGFFFKTISMSNRASLQFRTGLFDVFDTAQFDAPGIVVGTPTFGVVTSARDPHIILFEAKVLL